ncbi:SDR family oxidoreductase [Sporolactobacillus spathodeae]|uniref:NAD(P)-dependent dehydrogenase (Short-subunit alcohol dehydrogenase family) n=1 Tax=Sporolactobacillus spathodeae TaxID=1465502 RepID=A0ABS2Q980_9BACL|nr:SDR family oxidoreductase [Sporolactobacillus spathodeae]MBM7658216.1 NAD(P)-dependent dehydrogenase (short-subunit alcohol dehydrogenase family) [Sporolactobacillus spathodeae]
MMHTTTEDPTKLYTSGTYPEQKQERPGIQAKMTPVPDCGEKTYSGSGKLTGRKALITGGDSGIGRAAAIAYAREGADVVLNYLPSEQEDALQVRDLIEKAGRKAILLPGDLSDENFCKQLVAHAAKQLDGLDILTLVAGMQHASKSIEEIPSDILRRTFEVNVFSLYWTVQAALPYLPKGASIITTSSVQGYNPSPDLLSYAPTKSAIIAFTKGLAKELAPKGIRVNSVAPGPIWTPLQVSGGQLPGSIPKFGQSSEFKRAGQPAELASVYVMLASNDSSFVTGQIYGVTGGLPTA